MELFAILLLIANFQTPVKGLHNGTDTAVSFWVPCLGTNIEENVIFIGIQNCCAVPGSQLKMRTSVTGADLYLANSSKVQRCILFFSPAAVLKPHIPAGCLPTLHHVQESEPSQLITLERCTG